MAIGFDVGGTRTKSGLVDIKTGEVIHRLVQDTEKNEETKFRAALHHAIQQHSALAQQKGILVSGIGFGVSSFVDGSGVVDSTYGFMPFMENYPLKKIIENEYQLPCVVDNDARAVALGEATYGIGKNHSRVLVLTLGTGLGIGFVKNRKLDDALPFGHMGGHIIVADNDHRCYCGKTGCLESLVASQGIRYLGERLNWEIKYPLLPLTAEVIFEAAKNGNTDALTVVNQLLDYLHRGIFNYVNLFAPDCIVLGGGIAKGLSSCLKKLNEQDFLRPYTAYEVQLTLSDLQEDAGILGAAALTQ